jgi:hypothetical protein
MSPSMAEIAEAERIANEHLTQRLAAEARASEADRLEQLRNAYRNGALTDRQKRASERSQWLHELAGSSLLPPGGRAIPLADAGEWESVSRASKQAVADTLRPLIAEVEVEIKEAEEERARFVRRGR